MATLQQSVVAIPFAVADPPAASSESDLVAFGLPDTVDMIGIVMPCTGAIVALAVTGSPASGDTVTVTPRIATSKSGAGAVDTASLATQITNATPAAYTVVSKDQADAQFTAGQFVSLRYQTTTGGTYTARDLQVTVFISTGRTDL